MTEIGIDISRVRYQATVRTGTVIAREPLQDTASSPLAQGEVLFLSEGDGQESSVELNYKNPTIHLGSMVSTVFLRRDGGKSNVFALVYNHDTDTMTKHEAALYSIMPRLPWRAIAMAVPVVLAGASYMLERDSPLVASFLALFVFLASGAVSFVVYMNVMHWVIKYRTRIFSKNEPFRQILKEQLVCRGKPEDRSLRTADQIS